jgi:hypothetical protein
VITPTVAEKVERQAVHTLLVVSRIVAGSGRAVTSPATFRVVIPNQSDPAAAQDLTPEEGWRKIYDQAAGPVEYSPHYVSYQWAVYLWGYHVSGFAPLLERAQAALGIMMAVRQSAQPVFNPPPNRIPGIVAHVESILARSVNRWA